MCTKFDLSKWTDNCTWKIRTQTTALNDDDRGVRMGPRGHTAVERGANDMRLFLLDAAFEYFERSYSRPHWLAELQNYRPFTK